MERDEYLRLREEVKTLESKIDCLDPEYRQVMDEYYPKSHMPYSEELLDAHFRLANILGSADYKRSLPQDESDDLFKTEVSHIREAMQQYVLMCYNFREFIADNKLDESIAGMKEKAELYAEGIIDLADPWGIDCGWIMAAESWVNPDKYAGVTIL